MRHIIGLFSTRSGAESAIHRLKAHGISQDEISVAMKDPGATGELIEATAVNDMSVEGAAAGAVSGAAIGVIVGLAVAGATFVLPGVGTFLLWGPLAAALSGASVGAASGGLLGALIGSGIPEPEAHHYLTGLEKGDIIITVSVPNEDADNIRFILNEEGSQRTNVG